ncbi:hypothetical protein LOTGIDRAFT_118446 [Lottia gigantea]|uniref:Threonylcarbamoyl-AMP synthase n=1 Tax=Lottia gigantea TaxID=225164 RepID=V4ACD1_LOTGI|nr:hypothetical protein LOTGIDRAFT_118446 [Lottia gigantea]ESO94487.1 hypothetical protein LOTGIDRAFT_118446 [Lottia gigantea]
MKRLEPQPELFASILYAEPGALGLLANIVAALIVAIENIYDGPFTHTAYILAVILCTCAVTVNYIMPPVMFALLLTLIFEGVGSYFSWGKKVAAAFEIFIVLTSSYAVIVMTLKGVSQRYLLPGFGNAPFDPLLIRTKPAAKKKHEKKKNTKYAEPMGMGYIGNIVPAAVLVFHKFGFFIDFRPAMPMLIVGVLCHILGSFYAFLRHDLFHSVQFVVYFVFWTTRFLLQLFITIGYPVYDRYLYFGQWGLVGMLLILSTMSTCHSKTVFFYNLLFTITSILSVEQIPTSVHNYTFGVSAAILALASMYVAMAHLANSIAEKPIMFLGLEIITQENLTSFFKRIFDSNYTDDDKVSIKIVDTIGMVSSALALSCLAPVEATNTVYPLTGVIVAVKCFNANPAWMILVTSVLTACIAFYAAFAEITNSVLQDYIVPVGEPILKEVQVEEESQEPPCPLFSSQRTSNLLKVADILDKGGVVGTPTDTVYALGASCKHPESIKRIYHIKGRPPEKPICLCLSDLDQLVESNPVFSPLLWAFMRRCYPGGISCVVPKGPWMQNLGLGDAVQYVGTKESICIRVPDSTVLAYLVSLSGPIALTSANPSGGADSIHHDMVINSLGHKLDGIICDGKSNELVASTVVNCLKIDEGVITYFRIGCTPKERVDQLFEEAKAEINSTNSSINLSVNYST